MVYYIVLSVVGNATERKYKLDLHSLFEGQLANSNFYFFFINHVQSITNNEYETKVQIYITGQLPDDIPIPSANIYPGLKNKNSPPGRTE